MVTSERMSSCADFGAPPAAACAQMPEKSVIVTAVVTPEKPPFHVEVETYDASCTLKAVPFTVPLTDPAVDVLVPLPQPIARNTTQSSLRMTSQCSALAAHGIRRMAYNHCRRPPGAEAHP